MKFRKEKKKKETCNITRLWTRYFPCTSINDKIYEDWKWNEKIISDMCCSFNASNTFSIERIFITTYSSWRSFQ